MSTSRSKLRTHGESAAHLKLEKPRFLFLEGSGGATVVPADAAVAPADSSTDDPVAGATSPAVGTYSMASSAAHGDGGGGLHLSEGRPSSLSSSYSDDEFIGVVGGGESSLLTQPVLLALLLPALSPPDSPLLRARRPLLLPPMRGAGGRPRPGASADLIARCPPSPSADGNC
jgi:hypothetical protein